MRVKIHRYSMSGESWFPREIEVPEERAAAFREQAQRNHSQTIERLNERGGLSPEEIYWVWHGMKYRTLMTPDDHIEALRLCVEMAATRTTAE